LRQGDSHRRGPFYWRVNGPVYLFAFDIGRAKFWFWDKDDDGLGFLLHFSLVSDFFWYNIQLWQFGAHLER
jgi:hypothetical protein